MSVLSISYFGPVVSGIYNLTPTWTADPVTGRGGATFAGRLPKAQAEQLAELVNNPDAAPTIGGVKGVLVPFWSEAPKARAFIGWYVLTGESHPPDLMGDGFRTIPFSLDAVYLGQESEIVIARSSVPKGNEYGLTAKSLVVSPFRPESDAGDQFIVSPGGTFATREYDPTSTYDPAVPTPTESAAIGFYTGTVTSSTDELETVCFPKVAWNGGVAPEWLTQQGGNCSAYDRTAERHVYGPKSFLESTDIVITNGLVRAWLGNRALNPFLSVWVFRTGTWRYEGTVRLSTTHTLAQARLLTVTAEEVKVAVQIQDEGQVIIGLRRGARRLDVDHGNSSAPSVARLTQWFNSPPVSFLGLVNDLYDDIYSDSYGGALAVVFSWPPLQSIDEWTIAAKWLPTAASTAQGTSGILSLFSASGTQAVSVWWDSADKKVKAKVGTTTVMSSAISFTAAQTVGVALRFSTTAGMALTLLPPGGSVAHVADATQLTPGASDYDRLGVGYAPGGSWTTTTWNTPGGNVTDIAVIGDRLSDTEAATLVTGAGFVGQPDEGRMVWYAPTVPTVEAPSGTYTSGRVSEATDGNGLARGVGALAGAASSLGVGMTATATEAEFSAFVATLGTSDTAADHHSEFAAESDQELRVR